MTYLMKSRDFVCISLSKSTPSIANLRDIDFSNNSLYFLTWASNLAKSAGFYLCQSVVYLYSEDMLTFVNLGRSLSMSAIDFARCLMSLSRFFSVALVDSMP